VAPWQVAQFVAKIVRPASASPMPPFVVAARSACVTACG
jgi:hypothetical protein